MFLSEVREFPLALQKNLMIALFPMLLKLRASPDTNPSASVTRKDLQFGT
jgi:hypothetical protein